MHVFFNLEFFKEIIAFSLPFRNVCFPCYKHLLFLLVDGNWGEWSEWSACTKTCKQGKQSRTRKCDSPSPQYGGKICSGKPKEVRICNKNVPCPGKQSILFANLHTA